MRYCIFSENEWVYPDSHLTTTTKAELYSPRNADACFQILTDMILDGSEKIDFSFEAEGCLAELYLLKPVKVAENSDPVLYTTTDYESVKDFVTREAPFDVYDITCPLDAEVNNVGRLALYVRINVENNAAVGIRNAVLSVNVGNESISIPVSLKIYSARVPELSDANFHMVNWIYYNTLAEHHGVEVMSDEYKDILKKYLENQIDMRNDYLMIPGGEPVFDENGAIAGFDFSHAEYVGNLALSYGFNYIMGHFVAHWTDWKAPELVLLWDRSIDSASIEGYRQLKLYFEEVRDCISRNGWDKVYMQCLVDEPQIASSLTYRALSGICRKHIRGIVINDPIETPDIGGALDVWVVKQAIYEKYYDSFKSLQDMGEEMWIYTCGFPSGKTMNRILDLPLTVSRLPMWMCYKYGCPGFLHWGYHAHDPQKSENAHYLMVRKGKYHPAGNSFVVLPGDGRPWYGVRAHSQRLGAYDYELLHILGKTDKEKALSLVSRLCRSFDDYDPSSELFDDTRKALLEALG